MCSSRGWKIKSDLEERAYPIQKSVHEIPHLKSSSQNQLHGIYQENDNHWAICKNDPEELQHLEGRENYMRGVFRTRGWVTEDIQPSAPNWPSHGKVSRLLPQHAQI